MRNLKKILALVLAMVMTFSVMATANAFTDDKDIDATYDEAIEVLSALEVFEGYEDGSFQPKGSITRAEVAAIIYRVVTGDVDNKQVGIYADYNKFTDVKSTAWYAGYVNYCANGEYIKGYGDGTFGPNDQVTGYQALAMILRAIGRDKNDEFTGAGWQVQTAAVGKQLGITDNITAGTLGTAATREVVAEILFQTIANVDQFDYTLAFGYTNYGNNTLGYDTFKLTKGDRTTVDNWGRPGYNWYVGSKVLCCIEENALHTSYVAETQCDIAKAVSQKVDTTYDLYDNSAVKNGTQKIAVLATTAKVGAQGQILEVYKDRIVLIDTLLAKVEAVADATYDVGGHRVSDSKITLSVYQTSNAAAAEPVAATVIATNGATNYTYAVGDYVLINAHLNSDKVIVNYLNIAEYLDILSVASSVDGTQTVIWYQANQHTVNGTTYDDADRFHLNINTTSTSNRTWFFDQFGNLIGDVEVATNYSYAAVKNMWWAGDYTTGLGVAKATLVYMDGTENVVTVSGIAKNGDTTYATPVQSDSTSSSSNAMEFSGDGKYVYIASYQPTNTSADTVNGIITYARTNAGEDKGNLFRVATKTDGTVLLDEVTAQATAKILAKYAYITADLKVNSNTQFLMYNTTTKTFSAFSDFNNMPNFQNSTPVIDYVKGSDGYAKYVYIIGTPDTTTTYNFVMPLSVNYSAELKTSGGVNYYVITVTNVDGTETTLKVKTADFSSILNTLVNNVNNLYYVTFTGEYATGLVKVQGISQSATTAAPYTLTGLSTTLAVSTLTDDAASNAIVRTGNDLAYGIFHFNVTEATEIIGTLPEGRQTAKTVYVLHNAVDNTAVKVWVVANGSAVTTPAAPYITSVSVAAVTAPAKGTLVADYTAPTVTFTSSDLNCHGTVTANITWYVLSGGSYVPYTGTAFGAGTYQAVVTVTVNNTVGEYYAITSSTAVTYNGTASTSVFTVQPLTVA